MPTYTTKVTFYRSFKITARDAKDANQQLEDLVHETEFGGDVEHDGFEVFEDEPVECPECKGDCVIDDRKCGRCNGEGLVPFEASK